MVLLRTIEMLKLTATPLCVRATAVVIGLASAAVLCGCSPIDPYVGPDGGKLSDGDPFSNVSSGYYWTSTTYSNITIHAWVVSMSCGSVGDYPKSSSINVWPVRDPL